jgi:hypothetical protein
MTSAATQSTNQFTQTLTGYPFGGAGSYTANCSSFFSGLPPWKAFDRQIGPNKWASGANEDYSAGVATTNTQTSGIYNGAWLQIQLPISINLFSYSITASPLLNKMPSKWYILGSNDGSSWTLVDSQQTGVSWSGSEIKTLTPTPTIAYLYYRMVINQINDSTAGGNLAEIGEWILYGAPPNTNTDFYADRLGNLLTVPVTGQRLANWLGGATGYVTTWYDQSGSGNHMSCSSAGIQPKIDLANNFIDLKPSAYFDVSAGTTGPVPFQSSKNYTVVFRHGQFLGSGLFSAQQNAGGPYGNLVNNFKKGTGATYTQYWYGNDVINKGVLATGNRVSYKWDGANRSLYVNGALADATASSGWSQTSSAIQMIGKTTFDAEMNGELYGAFMFTTALSDADRNLVEAAS